jgi:hypothetical protein
MPDLEFSVEHAAAIAFSAVPALALKVHIVNHQPEPIRSVALTVQVRIAAGQRAYAEVEQERLLDVFGEPPRWGQTLKSLLWTIGTIQVPAFRAQTTVDLPIQCTYDFEVVSAKYFHALEGGSVPLELLFSGPVFFVGDAGLQVEHLSWNTEARFAMPVSVWHDVMQRYFPGTTWLRLQHETFERLARYRARNALPSWEATLERLLQPTEHTEPQWTR